jgi:hemoglobin
MSAPPTLYEWVKGRPAIARLIDCFYDRVERDDLLSPFSLVGSALSTGST